MLGRSFSQYGLSSLGNLGVLAKYYRKNTSQAFSIRVWRRVNLRLSSLVQGIFDEQLFFLLPQYLAYDLRRDGALEPARFWYPTRKFTTNNHEVAYHSD